MLLQLSRCLTWGAWGAYKKKKKTNKSQERRNGEFNLAGKQSDSKLNWLALDQKSKSVRKSLKFQNEHLSNCFVYNLSISSNSFKQKSNTFTYTCCFFQISIEVEICNVTSAM